MRKLNPKTVIPSHGVLDGSFDAGAVEATAGYLRYVIDAMKDGGNSAELSGDLLRHFTGYANTGVVELGTKVLTGEIIW